MNDTQSMTNNERFNQLLNSCTNPRAVYDALLVLGRTGLLDKLKGLYKPEEGETV